MTTKVLPKGQAYIINRLKKEGLIMEKLIYSLSETAEILGISRVTFYKLLDEGKIRGFQIGRVWEVSRKRDRAFCRRTNE